LRYTDHRTNPTHENFEAHCPYCDYLNVFNRATDLNDSDSIDGEVQQCRNPKCQRSFALTYDSIDPTFALLYYEAQTLLEHKRFGDAIVKLATSVEQFFTHSLFELLAWQRVAANESDYHVADAANRIAARLTQAIHKAAYQDLRNLFLHMLIAGPITSIQDAERIIDQITIATPSGTALATLADPDIQSAAHRLKMLSLHEVRNRIIHHTTYRPAEQEARALFQETEDVMWTLVHKLDVRFESLGI
jgi:hypothetical protein